MSHYYDATQSLTVWHQCHCWHSDTVVVLPRVLLLLLHVLLCPCDLKDFAGGKRVTTDSGVRRIPRTTIVLSHPKNVLSRHRKRHEITCERFLRTPPYCAKGSEHVLGGARNLSEAQRYYIVLSHPQSVPGPGLRWYMWCLATTV